MKQAIKARDLGISHINIEVRKADATEAQLLAQSVALTLSILKGLTFKDVNPLDASTINWRPDSTFIVERNPHDDGSKDAHDKPFSTLSGTHRLMWILDAAKKDERWLDFEVLGQIVSPLNDADRRAFVARGNAGKASAATMIPPSLASIFAAFYERAPRPDYLYVFGTDGKTLVPAKHSQEGWKSPRYMAESLCNDGQRVTLSALTRLGRHFNIPLEVFSNKRLRIKPEVTPALLGKEKEKGDGTPRTKELGIGLEPRYMKARAECTGATAEELKKSLDACAEVYKAEFLDLLDVNTDTSGNILADAIEGKGSGENSLGNTPALSKEEKNEKQKQEEEAQEIANERAQRNLIAERCIYRHEKGAVARFFNLGDAPKMDVTIGNAMDLLTVIPAAKFANAAAVLAAFQSDGSKAQEALDALTDCLVAMRTPVAMPAAAHAVPNTKKKAK